MSIPPLELVERLPIGIDIRTDGSVQCPKLVTDDLSVCEVLGIPDYSEDLKKICCAHRCRRTATRATRGVSTDSTSVARSLELILLCS